MLLLRSLGQQLTRMRLIITGCFTIGMVGIAGVVLLSHITGMRLDYLVIDPADVEMRPAYIGILSQFGIMLWAAGASVSFFGANLIQQSRHAHHFLFASGCICTLLLMDDALLLHDRVFPDTIGINETIVYLVYLGIILLYLYRFSQPILETEYVLLLIGGLLLGLSVSMDRVLPFTPMETFYEDSIKFMGIVFLFAYFAVAANDLVRKEVTSS